MTADSVDLWWFRAEPGTQDAQAKEMRALEMLDEPERQRFRQIETAEVARFFAFRRAARRLVLASYLGCAPAAVRLSEDADERPRILRGGGGLEFSASHSGTTGLVAVVRGQLVGADLEIVRPIDHARFAERILSPAERMHWQGTPAEKRTALIFRAWTAKEAIIKAAGLALDLATFRSITAPIGEEAEVWAEAEFTGSDVPEGDWRVYATDIGGTEDRRTVASIAVLSAAPPADPRVIDAGPLLRQAGLA